MSEDGADDFSKFSRRRSRKCMRTSAADENEDEKELVLLGGASHLYAVHDEGSVLVSPCAPRGRDRRRDLNQRELNSLF